MVANMERRSLKAADPLVQMQSVSFGYSKQTLLYDVSVQIRSGEMVGLLGPNGSGKTTLLRLLSGAIHPRQGQVLLLGKTLRQWGRRATAQRVAVVPQEMHMPFAFTVEEMVQLGRTPFVPAFFGTRGSQDEKAVQEAMEIAGVSAFAKRSFNELSGGERQRVTIAMALAQEPALLLLDEPTAHLDIKYQIETLALAQRLNRERGVTIIAALHDLNLAARYFPRLLLFQRGIVADASPAEVLQPELLSRVYGIPIQVGILRGSQHLSILPPVDDAQAVNRKEGSHPLIHVMAGGGSGELLMRALADAQLPFVAGALNVGDSDHALALRLAQEVITEQPFAPISLPALTRVQQSLEHVRVLLICPTAIGPGNLILLQEAYAVAQRGVSVLLLQGTIDGTACTPPETGNLQRTSQSDFSARDYTGGQGAMLLEKIISAGGQEVSSVVEALELVKSVITA
ncbi:ABC transporter ATP-binding protein [Tengunoibacter tsumagoiensis]|uniref:ABC transporter n=1 Tax=Tengunoibacter tsumagoiensis TaxID=2014871 RepID=A0A402A0T6_9CHLR|nr:ABC transporter ATP-binding protein [Tengunoibacter tsumagoiensis]GCE12669.1 ABC transporter [Tengunoibacter tsumagoiensis]